VQRVTVRCGVANFGVIGPYFFEDEVGLAVTVTSARYVEMLWNFLTPQISVVEYRSRLHGPSKMVQLPSMEFFREILPKRVISLRGKFPWPARWPNLSACDYFLYGTSV
jgi:hypothetical protein